MGRYGVKNTFGMLVYLQLNAASSIVFVLSRMSVQDLEQTIRLAATVAAMNIA